MKKVISVMLVIGMMLCTCSCGDGVSDPMADIYYSEERQSNYYSNYNMSNCWEIKEDNSISGGYDNFNGMVTLWFYEDEGGFPVDINYCMKVSQGKAKIIMYYTDGVNTSIDIIDEITTYNVVGESQTLTVVLQKGLSCIKIVGMDDADVEYELRINNGSFIGTK